MTKKEVPQINKKNGVSADYWNEFFKKLLIIKNISELKEDIKINPIKKYKEYFPEETYKNVVNSMNIKFIEELDEIVIILNSFGQSDLSIEDFERFLSKANSLIYNR